METLSKKGADLKAIKEALSEVKINNSECLSEQSKS